MPGPSLRSADHWSAVDHALHVLGVAGTLDVDLGGGGLDLLEVGVGEGEVCRSGVLREPGEPAGAGDGDHPRLLGK